MIFASLKSRLKKSQTIKESRNEKKIQQKSEANNSIIFLFYLNLTRKHIELRSNLFPFVLIFYQLKRFRYPRFLRFLKVTYQSNSRYSISTLFFFSALILFCISFLFKDLFFLCHVSLITFSEHLSFKYFLFFIFIFLFCRSLIQFIFLHILQHQTLLLFSITLAGEVFISRAQGRENR